MHNKKALICGISGQDGSYLAKFLLEKGYRVFGSSRDCYNSNFTNLKKLNILNEVDVVSITLNDFRSVIQALVDIQPDEIYNLAGQSSVRFSFEHPVETLESINIGTLNLLESIRFLRENVKFYNAGSSECFGNTNKPVDEKTSFKPRSPYGVAKSAAFWTLANYREAYSLFGCTGILFNHESPLRKKHFVTKKIISTVCRIAKGSKETLTLGNLDVVRDWGWAPEYVEAMWLILQQDKPDDYVVATGNSYSLQEFIEKSFQYFNLNWKDYVEFDTRFYRPTDIAISRANPRKAEEVLNWKAKVHFNELIHRLLECELNSTPY